MNKPLDLDSLEAIAGEANKWPECAPQAFLTHGNTFDPPTCLQLIQELRGAGVALEVAKETLRLYSHLKPEQMYSTAGMTEDQQVAFLESNPEMLVRFSGGRLAKAALAKIAALSGAT